MKWFSDRKINFIRLEQMRNIGFKEYFEGFEKL